MLPYIVLFMIPVFAVLSPWKADVILKKFIWIFFAFGLILFIGFRNEIGGDWLAYVDGYPDFRTASVDEAFNLNSDDLGYSATRLFFGRLDHYWNDGRSLSIIGYDGYARLIGRDIFFTNLFCAAIFSIGLLRFCNVLPFPWLGLVVSVPYLIIVVAMGYTRQAVSIGFIMWGMVDLLKYRYFKFLIAIFFAILFHKPALILMAFTIFINKSKKDFRRKIFAMAVISPAMILIFLVRFDHFYNNYYASPTNAGLSYGGGFRIAILLVSVVLFLFFRKSWKKIFPDSNLWLAFCGFSFILIFLFSSFPVATDRVALYLYPFQLIVFGRLPMLIRDNLNRTLFVFGVILFHATILFTWLIFAVHSEWWLPYQNYLTTDFEERIFIKRNFRAPSF
ncbi:MAG: EpsG family protein [Leptospiraceae bacterium]|nr:EpsG family protein [Leptospiraceae bacterium]